MCVDLGFGAAQTASGRPLALKHSTKHSTAPDIGMLDIIWALDNGGAGASSPPLRIPMCFSPFRLVMRSARPPPDKARASPGQLVGSWWSEVPGYRMRANGVGLHGNQLGRHWTLMRFGRGLCFRMHTHVSMGLSTLPPLVQPPPPPGRRPPPPHPGGDRTPLPSCQF